MYQFRSDVTRAEEREVVVIFPGYARQACLTAHRGSISFLL
jgi:hypothetical protein